MLAAVSVALVACGVSSVASGSTQGGLTAAVQNTVDTGGSGLLSYALGTGADCHTPATVSAPGGPQVSCAASLLPPNGSSAATTTITSSATVASSGITEQAAINSCGVEQFADSVVTSDPMLTRFHTSLTGRSGTPLAGGGHADFNGSTDYAADVTATQNPLPSNGLIGLFFQYYAAGVWFRTTTTSGGALFGFGSVPDNSAGTFDRMLFMQNNGTLAFQYGTGSAVIATTTALNDGNWHFAYLTFENDNLLNLGSPTTRLFVDGATTPAGSVTAALTTPYNGYWHVGWSPVARAGTTSSYFAGSLADLTVFDTNSAGYLANGSTLFSAGTQATFDSRAAAATATNEWSMKDAVAAVYPGPYPSGGAAAPCAMASLTWGFTSPLSCAFAPSSTTAGCTTSSVLATAADGSWHTVATATPGTPQSATLTLSRNGSFVASAAGLQLYAPQSLRMVAGTTGWTTTFSWGPVAAHGLAL